MNMVTKTRTSAAVRLDRVNSVPTDTKPRTPAAKQKAASTVSPSDTPAPVAGGATKASTPTTKRVTSPSERAIIKRLHHQPQAVTAALGATPATLPVATKSDVNKMTTAAMTDTAAPKIRTAAPKSTKKKSHRMHRRQVGREFVVADVPVLDSPEWSSEDEIDNPKFNREFRQKHNEQLRRLLKESEALARKEAAPAGVCTARSPMRSTDVARTTNASPSPSRALDRAGKDTAGVVVRNSMSLQRAVKRPSKPKNEAETLKQLDQLSHCASLLSDDVLAGFTTYAASTSPATTSFAYEEDEHETGSDEGEDSDSHSSQWDTPASIEDAFFFGDYGMTYSVGSSASGSKVSSRAASPTSIVLSASGAPMRVLDSGSRTESIAGAADTSTTYSYTKFGESLRDCATSSTATNTARASAGAGAPTAPAAAVSDSTSNSAHAHVSDLNTVNTSLHATFAPSTMSPVSQLRPTANHRSQTLASATALRGPLSQENAPTQLPVTEDLLFLPLNSGEGGRVRLSSYGPVCAENICSSRSVSTRGEAGAASAATTVGAGTGQAPLLILSHSRSDRRISVSASQHGEGGFEVRRLSTHEVRNVQATLLVLYSGTDEGDEHEYDLGFDQMGSDSLDHQASDLDAFSFAPQTTITDPFGTVTRAGATGALRRGPSARTRPPTIESALSGRSLARHESPIPGASFVLAGTLSRSGKRGVSRPAGAGVDEDDTEYWDLVSVGNTSEGPCSLLAKTSSLRRRDSQTILQSTRRNPNYFGSINPFSYHAARLATSRKGSHSMNGGPKDSMLRLYSLVRGGRRTNNTATVAISEPVTGMSAESRPYSTMLAKPVHSATHSNNCSSHVSSASSATPSSFSSSQVLVYSLFSDSVNSESSAPAATPEISSATVQPPRALMSTHTVGVKPVTAGTISVRATRCAHSPTVRSPQLQQSQPRGKSDVPQRSTASASGFALMHDAPGFSAASTEKSSPCVRRVSATTERETRVANEMSVDRRYSLPDSAPVYRTTSALPRGL